MDSGNLSGHLLTLRVGLQALAEDKILSPRLFAGLSDTFSILAETADNAAAGAVLEFRQGLESAAALPLNSLPAAHSILLGLLAGATKIVAQCAGLADRQGNAASAMMAEVGEGVQEALAWACLLYTSRCV